MSTNKGGEHSMLTVRKSHTAPSSGKGELAAIRKAKVLGSGDSGPEPVQIVASLRLPRKHATLQLPARSFSPRAQTRPKSGTVALAALSAPVVLLTVCYTGHSHLCNLGSAVQ